MMAIIFPLARVLQKSGFGNFPFGILLNIIFQVWIFARDDP